MRHAQQKRLGRLVTAAVAMLGGLAVSGPALASTATLTQSECAALVEEGEQARQDLADLFGSSVDGGQAAVTSTTFDVGSYLDQLNESAAINQFGFVSGDAGAPLDVCLPKGTTKLTMFSTPVVLWEGEATTDAYPVTVTIPADAECGEHTMQATGPGVDESTEFTVAGDCVEPGSTGGSDLPRTGVEIGGALAIGLGLIAIGYAAVRGRRGRTAA